MSEERKAQLFEEFANAVQKFYESGMPYEQWRESISLLYTAYCEAIGKHPKDILKQCKQEKRI